MRSSRRNAASTQQAADAVHAERAKLAHWEAEEAAARAELASLQDRAGAEVLDNPDAASSLTRHMQELRDRADIAQRAAAAQQPRVRAAERAYLLAEAEVLEEPVKRLQAQLERHQARTVELLKVLEEHEGRFVPENLLLEEQWRSDGAAHGGVRQITLLKSNVLEDELAAVRRPVLVLRELAEGRDPMQLPQLHGLNPEDCHPACVWGPDVVVPAPAYVRTLQIARERVENLERLSRDTLPTQVAELSARLAEDPAGGEADRVRRGLDETKRRLAKAEEDLAQANAELDHLAHAAEA